jgi:anti-sigma28 factor (negative regulator of flagellin synthesis)
MHEHGPDELFGPVRGTTAWWRGMAAATDPVDEGLSVSTQPPTEPKKGRKNVQPIRRDLVDRVRKEIAAGTYDTEEKWHAALDGLLDRMERD